MKSSSVAFAAALLLAGTAPAWAQHRDHRMVSPDELKWSDVPSLPPGAKIALIEGPMERVTVLTGTFYMGTGDKLDPRQGASLAPGSLMILQPKTHHYAWTRAEEVIVQLNGTGPWGITYLNLSDDPRKK